MLCNRGGPILSTISAEFFIVFPFTIKSVQFMSGAFLLIVAAFSDVMEELELNFSFAEAEFWIVFSFSMLSAWILSGVFSLLDDLLISELTLEFEFTFSFAIVEFVTSEFSLVLIINYESNPCTVGLLNIIFLLTSSSTIVSMKSLSTLMATIFET